MNPKIKDVQLRSDRVLVVALAAILSAGSAVVGAAAANHPSTDKSVTMIVPPVKAVPPKAAVRAPAPVIPVKHATAADVALAQLLAEHRCLSEVMYYEARGEGREGQLAVAEVVFHRLRHGHYGNSICSVVYEGAGAPGCQFSFTCNGDLADRKSQGAWRQSEVLAAQILSGQIALRDITGNATFFHAASISPDWVNDADMERTVQIGNHVFYKRVRSRAL